MTIHEHLWNLLILKIDNMAIFHTYKFQTKNKKSKFGNWICWFENSVRPKLFFGKVELKQFKLPCLSRWFTTHREPFLTTFGILELIYSKVVNLIFILVLSTKNDSLVLILIVTKTGKLLILFLRVRTFSHILNPAGIFKSCLSFAFSPVLSFLQLFFVVDPLFLLSTTFP